ncbi:MAG: amidohydrolase [Candidatus Marinimicrobia bacterium]|nr:amidohydrolase [Candidatus Neomarinimicrobiota bacterium]
MEQQLIAWRRHFHQHPETGFEEHETGRYIVEQLQGIDVEIQHPVAQTGVVALMSNGDGPTIALRADMDALPIQETGDVPYKSTRDGVMHACGHDAHMATLLGAATALDQLRDQWHGTIKFIFQPGEEGFAGAKQMIDAGVLKDPQVAAIFGLHVWNYQDYGTVGVKPGPTLAAADEFEITVTGTGGHAALPQQTVDIILVAAQLVVALQSIVSRNLDPLESGVVSIGMIRGGQTFNVIPTEVLLKGTARAMREEDRLLIKARIGEICQGVASTYGAAINLNYHDSYPPTINDAQMSSLVLEAARVVVGDGAGPPFLSMGGEDMAFFLQEVPGCFFFVGSAKPEHRERPAPHHCAHFDINERALAVGASVFIEIVQRIMPGA